MMASPSAIGENALTLLAEPAHRQAHAVAGFEEARRLHAEADPCRRTGRDHIAGGQRHEVAEIAHDLRAVEDHVAGRALLHHLAADLANEVESLRIGNFVSGDEPGTDRREGVATLALGPLATALHLKSA